MGISISSCLCGGSTRKQPPSPDDDNPKTESSHPATPTPPPAGDGDQQQHRRSSSSVSKLVSSVSGRVRAAVGMPEEEESVWKKTIILGEKCRVPDNDDEEDEENGNRVSTYHRRGKTSGGSVLFSRQSSCADNYQGPDPTRLGA